MQKDAIPWAFGVSWVFGCVPQQQTRDRAMRLPLLSMTLACLIARHWLTCSRHLGFTELPRYLWIATFLLLACHAWSFSEFIFQGWFTSALHHCVTEVLLMIYLPRNCTPLCYAPCQTLADRGDLILPTCSSPEDVLQIHWVHPFLCRNVLTVWPTWIKEQTCSCSFVSPCIDGYGTASRERCYNCCKWMC